jgi:4-diphosphocytidyl-2-C-methyl-D-erythritol kinase
LLKTAACFIRLLDSALAADRHGLVHFHVEPAWHSTGCGRKQRMHVRRTGPSALVHAPAKINLFLEVLARRPDGFHEIETLMAAAAIYDTLVFEPHEGSTIELHCRWGAGFAAQSAHGLPQKGTTMCHTVMINTVPAGPENLVWRAIDLLRQRSGGLRGCKVLLIKRIPMAAGLGGASSDAAAALVAANLVWGLGWSMAKLQELAAELGSDVPFFLTSGAAVCRGRGERIEPIRIPRVHIVVVRPPVGISTPEVYKRCQPAAQPERVAAITEAAASGEASRVARQMTNRLQQPAAELTPWIDRLSSEFHRQDCLGHQMSGSGSSYFGVCRHRRQARRLASRLRARRLGVVHAVQVA